MYEKYSVLFKIRHSVSVLTAIFRVNLGEFQDYVLLTRHLWLIWSKMLMTICLTVFCTIMNMSETEFCLLKLNQLNNIDRGVTIDH